MRRQPRQLAVRTEQIDGVSVIRVEGDVTLSTSARLRDPLLKQLQTESSPRSVVLDLSALAFLDSSGVATLIEGLKAGRDSGKRLVLAGLSGGSQKVLEFTRVLDLFEHFPRPEDALAAAQSSAGDDQTHARAARE